MIAIIVLQFSTMASMGIGMKISMLTVYATCVLGNDHRETLRTMNNLATLYGKAGKHQEAEEIFEVRYIVLYDSVVILLYIVLNIVLYFRVIHCTDIYSDCK